MHPVSADISESSGFNVFITLNAPHSKKKYVIFMNPASLNSFIHQYMIQVMNESPV